MIEAPLDVFALARECAALPSETSWFEFKQNVRDAEMIGERISGLANAAAIEGRSRAYIIWGVNDVTHDLVGTTFDPLIESHKGQDWQLWLRGRFQPGAVLEFFTNEQDGVRLVVLSIGAAQTSPLAFGGIRYVRVGSHTKPLQDLPDLESKLFETLNRATFESRLARVGLGSDDVLRLLDHPALFRLLGRSQPETASEVRNALLAYHLVRKEDDGRWSVTNLGALLLAYDLDEFGPLSQKAIRLIRFDGKNKAASRTEIILPRGGYARIFEPLLDLLAGLLPRTESIPGALREERETYPQIAVREFVANALAHQDLSITGSAPMIELFSDRLIIRNPGKPLVDPRRFLDQDRARNGAMVELLRRMKICEKSGSGVDKAFDAIEDALLPSPDIRIEGHEAGLDETTVTLFAPKPFSAMTPAERVLAAYWHAAFKFNQDERMTNESLRNRLGLEPRAYTSVTGVINLAIREGLIALENPGVGSRGRRYVPFWAF